jgi:hypothetical protein
LLAGICGDYPVHGIGARWSHLHEQVLLLLRQLLLAMQFAWGILVHKGELLFANGRQKRWPSLAPAHKELGAGANKSRKLYYLRSEFHHISPTHPDRSGARASPPRGGLRRLGDTEATAKTDGDFGTG